MAVDVYPASKLAMCLTMIVKDEAHVVCDALQSVLPHIADYVIVDTGSTDETIRVIQRFCDDRGLPGRVLERPWKDFGSNRTEALQLAREHSDSAYLWMMDADDVLVGDPDFRGLSADGYQVRIGPTVEYWRAQIFKRTAPWRYVGVLHEYATCDAPQASLGQIQGAYHIVSRRLGARSRDPRKYTRDAQVLEAALRLEPDNPRYVFYLAQSYFDAGDFTRALEHYRRRASMGGWEQEVFYSRFRLAQCLERLNRPFDEVQTAYLECCRHHPSRAEPLVSMAARERGAAHFVQAYEYARTAASVPRPGAEALFVCADVYDYRALEEQAIAAFYVGRHEEAFRINAELLEQPALPEDARRRIEKNSDCSVPFIKDTFLRYDAAAVQRILERPRSARPQVTLSITACRRLDLFVKTVTSFLHACLDVDLIDRWICVDDNSSDADREHMQRLFPFFEFVWKGPAERGHARSMNIIRHAVGTPFLLHLEDDWHFFAKRKYIEPAIEILNGAPDLGQVCFNRNYAETLVHREVPGGFICFSWQQGYRYRIHEHYDPASEEYRRFHAARQGQPSHVYWPHYTLRPSVVKSKIFEKVGSYDESAGHFELEYAGRYVRAGLRSAFFDGIYCLHIGRLTAERGETSKPNAYALNQMVQFAQESPIRSTLSASQGVGEEPRRLAEDAAPFGASPCGDAPLAGACVELPLPDTVVINLDRRPDRLARFQEEADRQGLTSYRRFAAIDGTRLALTDEIRHLFRGNDFNYRRGIVGCALSHLELWRTIRQTTLIFEDDVVLADSFLSKLHSTIRQAERIDPDWDVIVLGWTPWSARHGEPPRDSAFPRLVSMEWNEFMGGGFAYCISPSGAAKLLRRATERGVQNAVDWFVMNQADCLRAYRPAPPIAFSPRARPDGKGDSDIQYDETSLAAAEVSDVQTTDRVPSDALDVTWPGGPVDRADVRTGVTFVTGFLDLSRHEKRPSGKSWLDYVGYAHWLLAQPVPLVVFAERDRTATIKALRPGHFPTAWVECSPEEMAAWADRDRIDECVRRNGPLLYSVTDRDTPLFMMTVWQKTEWLRRAVRENPFRTSHFAWIDLGIHRLSSSIGSSAMSGGIRRVRERPLPERIRMCVVDYVESGAFAARREFYKQHRAPVAGNLLVGRGDDLLWLADAFLAEWRQCLAEDICVVQEMMLGYLLHHHPDRFDVYYGRWATALANYGAVTQDHDYILSTVTRSRSAGDHAESRRRLDAIRPHLDSSNAAGWLKFWDEWYIANWYLGRMEDCRAALEQLSGGAMSDGAKRTEIEKKRDRLITNAGFLQQPASVAVVLQHQPSTLGEVEAMLRKNGLRGRVDVVVPGEFHPLMLNPGAIRYVPRSRFVKETYAAVLDLGPVRGYPLKPTL